MFKKNKIFFLIILCLQISLPVKSAPFLLKGSILGVRNGTIKMHFLDDNNNFKFQREVLICNGKFEFSGIITSPFKGYFIINDSLNTSEFYIDYGKQETVLKLDSLQNNIRIIGSHTDSEYLETYEIQINPFTKETDNWYDTYWQLLAKHNQKLPANLEDSMQKVYANILNKIDSVLIGYIKRNPSSYVGFWELYQKIFYSGYKPIYEKGYDLLSIKVRSTSSGHLIKKLLMGGKSTQIGAKFPFFPCVDSKDSIITSFNSNPKPQYVLIDFWFSYCSPCISQFNDLKKIYKQFKGEGFEILSISVDKSQDKKNWAKILNTYQLGWPQYLDENQKESRKLAINSFPTNFLLDKENKIIAKNFEPNQLLHFLEEHLSKGQKVSTVY